MMVEFRWWWLCWSFGAYNLVGGVISLMVNDRGRDPIVFYDTLPGDEGQRA